MQLQNDELVIFVVLGHVLLCWHTVVHALSLTATVTK